MKKIIVFLLMSTALVNCQSKVETRYIPAEPQVQTSSKSPDTRSFSSDGVINGGGGRGVVCPTPNGKGVTVELLDLYEAKRLFNLTLMSDEGTVEKNWAKIYRRMTDISKTEPFWDDDTDAMYQYDNLNKQISFLDTDEHLRLIEDSDDVVLKNGCAIVQVAAYLDLSEQILIDKHYWDLMNPLNKAALLFHEYAFHIARSEGDTTSELTRRYVGRLSSTNPPKNIIDGRPEDSPEKVGYYSCSSTSDQLGDISFYAYNETIKREVTGEGHYFYDEKLVKILFQSVPGSILPQYTTTSIGGTIEEVMAADFKEKKTGAIVSEIGNRKGWMIEFKAGAKGKGLQAKVYDASTPRWATVPYVSIDCYKQKWATDPLLK